MIKNIKGLLRWKVVALLGGLAAAIHFLDAAGSPLLESDFPTAIKSKIEFYWYRATGL